MTANDSKSFLLYLNKFIDPYNNIYHHSVNKKSINGDYFASAENIELNPKAPKFEINDRMRITQHRNNFSKGCIKNWLREIFFIDSNLKTNPCTYKINELN